MSDRYDPRERWRWDEEREREDPGLESEGRFARHGGDARWGTGGLGVDRRVPRLPPGVSAPGPYVGYGPRGYRRTDQRIHEDACERLSEHGDVDASDIEVSVTAGEVMLAGMVATRSQKRLAEDIVDAITGVSEVHNRLRVQRPDSEPPSRGSPAAGADRREHDEGPSGGR